jgi:hypothetical protein
MNVFKSFSVSTALILGSLLASSAALANTAGTVPDCSDATRYRPNSWIVYINEDNKSERGDLLAILRSVSTGGFSVGGIIPISTDEQSFVIAAEFDPRYYGNAKAAQTARDGALQEIVNAKGVTVYCNSVMIPYPGITIRN